MGGGGRGQITGGTLLQKFNLKSKHQGPRKWAPCAIFRLLFNTLYGCQNQTLLTNAIYPSVENVLALLQKDAIL